MRESYLAIISQYWLIRFIIILLNIARYNIFVCVESNRFIKDFIKFANIKDCYNFKILIKTKRFYQGNKAMKPKYNFLNNTKYAFSGICYMLKMESSFRIELCVIIPAFILSFFLPVSMIEHIALVVVLFVILIVECINSAIESCIDLITDKFHKQAKIAKDCASCAVFFSICLAVFIWVIILCKLILKFF